jgi:hypothetical protein
LPTRDPRKHSVHPLGALDTSGSVCYKMRRGGVLEECGWLHGGVPEGAGGAAARGIGTAPAGALLPQNARQGGSVSVRTKSPSTIRLLWLIACCHSSKSGSSWNMPRTRCHGWEPPGRSSAAMRPPCAIRSTIPRLILCNGASGVSASTAGANGSPRVARGRSFSVTSIRIGIFMGSSPVARDPC